MKVSKFLAFLVAFVAVISTSCKDEEDDPIYIPTKMDLNVDGFHARYDFGSFNHYHSDLDESSKKVSVVYNYDKIVNVTKYKADTTCYILFYKSADEVNEDMVEDQANEEYLIYDATSQLDGVAMYDTLLGEQSINATAITYNYEGFKFISYYLFNPNNKHAYRIRVQGPATSTVFWEKANEILATFRWQD